MPRRRPLRGWNQRQVSAMESMIPGTIGGRVSSAAPVLSASDVLAEQAGDVGVVAMSQGTSNKLDQFDLVSVGAQTLTLTFVPVTESEHVYLNGIEQREGTDWTRDDRQLSILAAMDVRVGDAIDVQYEYLAGAPLTPANPFDASVIVDDPLFYWRLGDADVSEFATAADSSGNGRDGTFTGTTLTHVAPPGLLVNSGGDGAVTSAGTLNDGVEIPYASWMNVSQASWEFWISSTDANGGRIFARESPTYVWSIQGDPTNLYFLASSSLIKAWPWSGFDGDSHHVVITYDGATVKAYLDGTLLGSQAWAGPLATPTDSMISVGHTPGAGTTASIIVGTFDEVAMYDYPLTADQVAAHYNAGTTP